MRLAAGTTLGPYRIVALLGAGGMGEVYRARDPRLSRDVAIKVLPAELLGDERRRQRFVQEARAASRLNHPHVVTIHEIEAAGGVDFIVMEYVAGQPLSARIPTNGMPLDAALGAAIPIADALSAAHGMGIVHRDLKPANVLVTDAGSLKVLDFGLAKLLRGADEDGSTTTSTATDLAGVITVDGTVAGTAAYMSPEQATGAAVDARSDIFSFGALLYEMVTGRRAFQGKSISETLTAVLRDQPRPPHELRPEIPEALERIILRCLRKDPTRRFQHMVDVKIELEELKEDSRADDARLPSAPVRQPRVKRPWMAATAALFALAAIVAAATFWSGRRGALPEPRVVQLSSERWAARASFSPDGTQIAYASAGDDGINWDIRLKIVGQAESRRLTTAPAAEDYPAWSPDGTQIAFLRYYSGTPRGLPLFAAGVIHVVSPIGGGDRKLSDFPARMQLAWSGDGRFLAAAKARVGDEPAGGIHLISLESGAARALTSPPPLTSDLSPAFSPDGRTLAYASCRGVEGSPICDVCLQALDADLRPQGAVRVIATPQRIGAPGLAWTRDGGSIVVDGLWRLRVDGSAPPERLQLAGGGRSPTSAAARDRLAFVLPTGGGADIDRLIFDKTAAPLLQSTYHDLQPQFSPDGARIAFLSARAGTGSEIWLANADGTNPTRLTRGPGLSQGYPGWSPDGRRIVFDSVTSDGGVDVWVIDASGSGLRQITRDRGDEFIPSWSRDGRSIYFVSTRSGREEIWRTSADGSGNDEQITREGGTFPFESWDGRTLYYKRGGGDTPLIARVLADGVERTVLPCVPVFGYAAFKDGIYYHDCGSIDFGSTPTRTLRFWDRATGMSRPVGTMEADWIGGLSVSPDGKSIIYAHGTATSDLMMIENVR